MDTAVVLGQHLTEAAGPVRDGAVADLATGYRQLGSFAGSATAGGPLATFNWQDRPAGDRQL
jgi:hypothetical protein